MYLNEWNDSVVPPPISEIESYNAVGLVPWATYKDSYIMVDHWGLDGYDGQDYEDVEVFKSWDQGCKYQRWRFH